MTIYLPRTLTHVLAALVGACAALLVALSLCALSPSADTVTLTTVNTTTTTVPTDCAEDMPCWDWETMGNRTRGYCYDGQIVLQTANPDGTYSESLTEKVC